MYDENLKAIEAIVSVIVPVYNHEPFLKDSLKSVFHQSYSNIDLVVVDDGSIDNSKAVITLLLQQYNFKFHSQKNAGISRTLNTAIRNHSTGKYIALLASDDYYHPDKIAEQVRMLEANPDAELCYTQAVEFDDATGAELRTFPARPVTGDVLNTVFLHQPYAAGSIMFTRDLFDRIGGFDEDLKIEDWDFSMRAAAATRFVAVKKPLFFYRSHGTNTLKKWTRRQWFAEKIKILAKNYALVSPARWFFVVLVHFVHDHLLMHLDRLRKQKWLRKLEQLK
jgi:alpha-1,3-rhamnosyltransferase